MDAELEAEMRRRGLLSEAQNNAASADPELEAEMQRRGLLSNVSQQAGQAAASVAKGPIDFILNAAGLSRDVLNNTVDAAAHPELAQLAQGLHQSPPGRMVDATVSASNFARKGNSMLSQALESVPGGNAAERVAGGVAGGPLGSALIAAPSMAGKALQFFSNQLPQTPTQLAGLGAGEAVGNMATERQGAQEAAALERASGKSPVLQAGPLQKVGAGALTIESAMQPKYAQAIVADPSILSEKTKGLQDVRQMYSDYFKSKNYNMADPQLFEDVFKSRYVPGESQASRMQGAVADVIDRLGPNAPKPASPEEVILAKQALGRLQGTAAAKTNPQLMAQYARDEGILSDALEKSGDGKLKELDRMYFRANAKDAAEAMFPQNKNMSPNALRGYLMLNMAADSAGKLVTGHPLQAAFLGAKAAAMSPYLATRAIAGSAAPISPLAQSLAVNMLGHKLYNQEQ